MTEHPASRGYVRYMDDLIWWGADRSAARAVLDRVREYLESALRLEVEGADQRSRGAATGFPFAATASLRTGCCCRAAARSGLSMREAMPRRPYARGDLDAAELQRMIDAALAITAKADALAWRREQLARARLAPALMEA